MQELIQQLVQKTGLSAQQAEAAITQVLGFLKSRLPEALHGQIDQAVGGGAAAATVSDISKGAGGKLGDLLSGK